MSDELVKRIAEKWSYDAVCPNCGNAGYVVVSRAEHDPRCDGTCQVGCPVEVQEQEQCFCELVRFESAIREALEAENEWVSVEERLPELAHDVLMCDEFGYQSVDYIDPDTGTWSRGGLHPDRVKFWRELPKAPAETEGKNG